jgi:sugar/nucleoside kinase (ribokinase family)
MTSCDVLGVGENSIDYVYRLPRYPEPGGISKVAITEHSISPGGQVATTLSACAALGLSTRYVGAFGADERGDLMRDELARRGIDVQYAPTRNAPGRYAVILIDDRTGERVVLWDRHPSLSLRADEVPVELIRAARLLHVDAVDEEAAIRAAMLGRSAGIPVTSDIDRITPHTRDLVASVSVPILAEGVAEGLTGEHDLEAALRALRRHHTGWLCVTRGAQGAVLLEDDELHVAPGVPVRVVDSTGAGDVFRGAFIYALLKGDAAADVLRFANAAAALSCTRHGAMASVPSLREVQAAL